MPALLLTDASVPYNFCKAGYAFGEKLAKHLGDDVHMVRDVHEELKGLAESLPALAKLIEWWPPHDPRDLSPQLTLEVADILSLNESLGKHPDEDKGETATVLYAEQRRQEGENFTLLLDDHGGQRLARDRGLKSIVNTPTLVVDMTCEEVLTYNEGARVWRNAFTNQKKWAAFKGEVQQRRPDLVP